MASSVCTCIHLPPLNWILLELNFRILIWTCYNGIFQIRDIYLTHWGRGTHICVGKLTIIGSDNGLSPELQTFSLKKIRLKMSSAKYCWFCLDLNVLNKYNVQGCFRCSSWFSFQYLLSWTNLSKVLWSMSGLLRQRLLYFQYVWLVQETNILRHCRIWNAHEWCNIDHFQVWLELRQRQDPKIRLFHGSRCCIWLHYGSNLISMVDHIYTCMYTE